MDPRLKYVAYMWRELKDEWYRIQTNSPELIRKLKRRTTARVCGQPLRGSTVKWWVFRLKYNKPKYAINGFGRLIGRNIAKRTPDGLFSADLVYKLTKKRQKEKDEVLKDGVKFEV